MKHRARTPLPRRIYEAVTWPTLRAALRALRHAPECAACGSKKIWPSRALARIYVGLLIRTKPAKRDGHTLTAYRCPFGNGWHAGRNLKTAALPRRRLP